MKAIVQAHGREYEIHPDGKVYRRRRRSPRHRVQLYRVKHPVIVQSVHEAYRKELREKEERKRRALMKNGKPGVSYRRPEKRSRLRRALGYPRRVWRAWVRARKIDPEAGVRTWARQAFTWARTD